MITTAALYLMIVTVFCVFILDKLKWQHNVHDLIITKDPEEEL